MPRGELYIRKKGDATFVDAFNTYGVSLSSGAINALLCPASQKEVPTNKSRLVDGDIVLPIAPNVDAREVALEMHLSASNEDSFWLRYNSFMELLESRDIELYVSKRPNDIFKLEFTSCTQFAQYMYGIAKYSLKFKEHNPKDRR